MKYLIQSIFILYCLLPPLIVYGSIPDECMSVWHGKNRDRICTTAVYRRPESRSLDYSDPEVQHQIEALGTCNRFRKGSEMRECCFAYERFADRDFSQAEEECDDAENIIQLAYKYGQSKRKREHVPAPQASLGLGVYLISALRGFNVFGRSK